MEMKIFLPIWLTLASVLAGICLALHLTRWRRHPIARRAERKSSRLPVTILFESNATARKQEAFTFDLSRLGVRIESDVRSLIPGRKVDVVLNQEERRQVIQSRVVWRHKMGPHHLGQAGLEFLASLSSPS